MPHPIPQPGEGGRFYGPAPAKAGGETVDINGRTLRLTHTQKVYWPDEGITKGDVIAYYRRAAGWILPYLRDRPESLRRNPNGVAGEAFFHKNMGPADLPYPWLRTETVLSDGQEVRYLLCQDEASLVHMANLGCIEINPWNSRVGRLDFPDWTILDLDPEAIGFDKVVETAMALRELLKGFRIPAACKTTGSRGLHIVIPLGGRYSYEQARVFSEILARLVHAECPGFTSMLRQPAARQKKVYLDCLQNARGQTLAAPYSLRPRPGAPVSTPLRWQEVRPGLDFREFNMRTIFKRLEKLGDLWKPVLGPGLDMEKALKRISASSLGKQINS